MKSQPTKYGYPLNQWNAAKEEIKQILIEIAKNRQTITYSDLVRKVNTINFEPVSYGLSAMLGEISSEEYIAGRGMLTAVVVLKDDGIPGSGFFELARALGKSFPDELKFWVDELNKVYSYWRVNG